MLLIDTSAWIEYFNRPNSSIAQKVDLALEKDTVLIGDLIFCEFLQGIRHEKDFLKTAAYFNALQKVSLGGFELARASAQNYRVLRKRGLTVRKTIDVLIGTYCILEQIPLLHCDRDFKPMALYLGLKEA